MPRRRKPKYKKEFKRPSQFVDWINIWKSEASHFTVTCLRSFDGKNIVVGPYLYKLIRRIERIEARIELEHTVRDRSYQKLLMDMINKMNKD